MTQTTTTTSNMTLTPSQFQIARSLARDFGHLWGAVPYGMFSVNDIQKWVNSNIVYPGMIAGIDSPSVKPWSQADNNPDRWTVIHQTGTGRLSWEITSFGNLHLMVFRPGDIQVADVWLICKNEQNVGLDQFSFSVSTEELANALGKPDKGEFAYADKDIHTEQLCERHVASLIRPIVSFLTAGTNNSRDDAVEKSQWTDEDRQKEAQVVNQYRAEVVQPAIEQAKKLLAPLYEIALPDPYFDGAIPFDEIEQWSRGERTFGTLREKQPEKYPVPQSFWTRSQLYGGAPIQYGVFHRLQLFPVESEKTAVHAVMLLQEHPDMPLIDAIRKAVVAESYRPE